MLQLVMYLAYKLGRTLDEIGRMDFQELMLWAAFLDEYDPEQRGDARSALIAATIANAHSRHGGYKVSDFMPRRHNQIDDPHQAQRMLKAWCASVGGRVIEARR